MARCGVRQAALAAALLFAATLASAAPTAAGGAAAAAPEAAPAAAVIAAAERAAAERGDLIYLNLIWHQHQPLYPKDDAGVYSRPWVRVHATKDYLDMASMLEKYPAVTATFNLTPVLLRQLDDLAAGAKDVYRVAAEKDATKLIEADKRFLLDRFFDTNRRIVERFPRYAELLAKRGGSEGEITRALASFSAADYRDLQVLFNLAWFDPDFLSSEPLASLVRKGRAFTEADKAVVFSESDRIVAQVVPAHRRLKETGRIEVITTPYAHPILPLVYNSDLGKVADPTITSPPRFSRPDDAILQLRKSVAIYESKFGVKPTGLWPGEGALSQEVVRLIADAGYRWTASGEPLLAKSLGLGSFSRDGSDTPIAADALYRPYYVESEGRRLAVVFRDGRLSDLIGFEYSGMDAKAAVRDFMDRLERIRRSLIAAGSPGPHLISVILDGENAWENYDNDGKAFLGELYAALSASSSVKTITPTRYLAAYPEQRKLEKLAPASWLSPDFGTWIGEDEENRAWDYLGRVREHLAKYELGRRKTSKEKLAAAKDAMLLAEGSDWFWWFGDDQDSGDDAYFDSAFRALLSKVYVSLGDPVPDFLGEPVIRPRSAASAADFGPTKTILSVDDPAGDDHGPGTYTYPTDTVFASGVFDLLKFEVAEAADALVFTFAFRGPLENPWKSPVGLSLPTIDVYIDEDGAKGTGARMLLEGRNAALAEGRGWERAVWIEGWNRKVFSAGSDGRPVELSGEPRIAVDAASRTVTVAVPRSILGAGDASRWSYAAVVLSQDGFPSAGVRRVRDVIAGAAERWKAGGAKADSNHTRIFDLALPSSATPTQEEALSSYPATPADPAAAASFPSIPLVSGPLPR